MCEKCLKIKNAFREECKRDFCGGEMSSSLWGTNRRWGRKFCVSVAPGLSPIFSTITEEEEQRRPSTKRKRRKRETKNTQTFRRRERKRRVRRSEGDSKKAQNKDRESGRFQSPPKLRRSVRVKLGRLLLLLSI